MLRELVDGVMGEPRACHLLQPQEERLAIKAPIHCDGQGSQRVKHARTKPTRAPSIAQRE
jgi:hypothetical protein